MGVYGPYGREYTLWASMYLVGVHVPYVRVCTLRAWM